MAARGLPLSVGGREVPCESGRTGEVLDPSTGEVARRARVPARLRELLESGRAELAHGMEGGTCDTRTKTLTTRRPAPDEKAPSLAMPADG